MREEVWALWSGETARRLRPESGATGWLRAAVQTMPQCFQSCVPGPQRRASWSKTLYEVRRDQGHRRIWPEGADRHGLALVVQGMRQTRQRRTCRTESHGPTGRYTAADGGGQVMYWLWREQAAERLLQTQRSERWAQPTLQVMRDCLQPCVRRAERGASRGMATNCRPTTVGETSPGHDGRAVRVFYRPRQWTVRSLWSARSERQSQRQSSQARARPRSRNDAIPRRAVSRLQHRSGVR